MAGGDHGAKGGFGIERIAQLGILQALCQAGDDCVLDALLHKHAGAVGADLTGGIEVAEDDPRDGIFDIGIIKDNHRGFAAQLHRYRADAFGGSGIDLAAGGHGAGERDFGHAVIGDQAVADLAHALNDVVKPCGQACLMQDLGDFEGGERRRLRRLENQRVAAGQGGRAFPASDLCRVIPRSDAGAEAQRLAPSVDEIAAQIDVLTGEGRCQSAEVFERVRAGCGVGDRGFRVWLTGVVGFENRQIVVAFAHDVCGAAQDTTPFGARHLTPGLLRGVGACEGLFNDCGRGGVDRGDDLACGGVNHLDGGAAGVFYVSAVDKVAGGGLLCHLLDASGGDYFGQKKIRPVCRVGRYSPRGKRWFSSSTLRSMWLRM